MIRVQCEDFDVGLELERLAAGNHRIGGVASFIGLVRDMGGLAGWFGACTVICLELHKSRPGRDVDVFVVLGSSDMHARITCSSCESYDALQSHTHRSVRSRGRDVDFRMARNRKDKEGFAAGPPVTGLLRLPVTQRCYGVVTG